MSIAILFHFLRTQPISDINISIIRSLRLFCWINTLVVLFLVRCVLEFRCGWVGVVSVLQASAEACNTDTTPTQPHRNSNTHRTKNITTNVLIQQNSRKLLMMDILMSETYWVHKKWNKIAIDIKLVFYSSTITMMHGPINTKLTHFILNPQLCGLAPYYIISKLITNLKSEIPYTVSWKVSIKRENAEFKNENVIICCLFRATSRLRPVVGE